MECDWWGGELLRWLFSCISSTRSCRCYSRVVAAWGPIEIQFIYTLVSLPFGKSGQSAGSGLPVRVMIYRQQQQQDSTKACHQSQCDNYPSNALCSAQHRRCCLVTTGPPSLPPNVLHTPHILVPLLLHLLLLDWAGRDLCRLAGRPLLRLVLLLRLDKGCAVPQLLDRLALLAALHHSNCFLQHLLVDLLNRL